MENQHELYQIVYQMLLTQIHFGRFEYGDSLRTMEEVSEQFLVSMGPIRTAYRRLKHEGYISLSQNIGAAVKVRYQEADVENHIRAFFAPRREALFDLSESMRPLFGHAQWLGVKHASPETLQRMAQLCGEDNVPPYALFQHLEQRYTSLGNQLLMRLIWQVYMFFQAPFFSIDENMKSFRSGSNYMSDILKLCYQEDWKALQHWTNGLYQELTAVLRAFYQNNIPAGHSEDTIPFTCNLYKKPSQLCYSLATELLTVISRRDFPKEGMLPTIEQLSQEKGVSASTVRRAYAQLRGIGAFKLTPKVGTRAIPLEQSFEHCDYTNTAVRKNLLNYAQCMHILTLSCRETAQLTLRSLEEPSVLRWKEMLLETKRIERPDTVFRVTFDLLSQDAPYQTLRTVYQELSGQLVWGYPLYAVHKTHDMFSRLFLPSIERMIDCLEHWDPTGFAAELEYFMISELDFVKEQLCRLGISEAGALLLPDASDAIYFTEPGQDVSH